MNWGPGNIDLDPLLELDFAPGSASPCIDAGDSQVVPVGVFADLYGGSRFVDDPDTADSGNGPAPIVDMGAVEYQVDAMPCPADVTEDGVVGFDDLVSILSTWGPCAGCPQDLDGDGAVGLSDLIEVLASWGPCP